MHIYVTVHTHELPNTRYVCFSTPDGMISYITYFHWINVQKSFEGITAH